MKKKWCIPTIGAEFVWRMEDVLDVYARPYDASRPVVCFDEKLVQLIMEIRQPLLLQPGRPARYDYEYKRNGTCNLFVFYQHRAGWRHVWVTDQRTKIDFAHCMRCLVEVLFPNADKIIVVLDNLNTHSPAALYETFEPDKAKRILDRLEFHPTPKHASWLNMVEIEIGVLSEQCLSERMPDTQTLTCEITAWETARNSQQATIDWQFSMDKARTKLKRLYPNLSVLD